VQAGGSGYHVNEQFAITGTNGRGIVTSVSGGVVTGIAILEAPTAGTLPSNPVSTSSLQYTGAGQSAGSGLTLNLTASTATGLGFNGASPIAKPTITGSKGSNAALASLITALASYGLVTDSTT
jgi:hypothetical protein